VQGLVVLGVLVMGDDKPVLSVVDTLLLLVVVVLLLLLVGVVVEGRQCPPHDLGAREALKYGPCFVIGHGALNSKGKLGCCHDVVIRAHPHAAISATRAHFTLDGSGRQGSEQRWFCGAPACNLVVVQVILINTRDLDAVSPLAGALGAPSFLWPP
jgi:hypothetical protein